MDLNVLPKDSRIWSFAGTLFGVIQGDQKDRPQRISGWPDRFEFDSKEQGHALESERAARLRNEEAIKEDQARRG